MQPERKMLRLESRCYDGSYHTTKLSLFQDWMHIVIAWLFPRPYFTTGYDSCVSCLQPSTLPNVDSLLTRAIMVSQVPPCNCIALVVLRYRHFQSSTLPWCQFISEPCHCHLVNDFMYPSWFYLAK
jgi:hypothetical protein